MKLQVLEVVANNSVLVLTGTEGAGTVTVTVITTGMGAAVEFHSPEDIEIPPLAMPVESGMPLVINVPVPSNDDVGGGKSSKLLLGPGGEYGGGGA